MMIGFVPQGLQNWVLLKELHLSYWNRDHTNYVVYLS